MTAINTPKYLLTLCALALGSVVVAQVKVPNPWPDFIPTSNLSVKLEKLYQIPQSSSSNPKARLICLREPNDGSGRIFVNDQRGELWVSVGGGDPTLFVDLSDEFNDLADSPGFGTGFVGFDFHPEFATNGLFYTMHNEETNSATADIPLPDGGTEELQAVLVEWTVNDPSANTWAGTRRQMIRFEQTQTYHGFQEIMFNKSATPSDSDYGHLYLTCGDTGAYGSQDFDQSYRLDSVFSKIMRIDPLGTNGRTGEYGIPADNPYVDGDPDTFDEIYARGFRNPHRISWDLGGDNLMFVGDIGERNFEEINIVESGNHYGWPYREGTFLFDPSGRPQDSNGSRDNRDWVYELPADDASFGYTYPVAQYDQWDEAGVQTPLAVCGGFVYRGSEIPSMVGQYVFGEVIDGSMFVVPVANLIQGNPPADFGRLNLYNEANEAQTFLEMVQEDSGAHTRTDLRFGQDLSGEIYVMSKRDRWVRKMVSADVGTGETLGGFPVVEDSNGNRWADTGDWIGFISLTNAPWVYVLDLDSWLYIEEPLPNAPGSWGYLSN